MAHGGGGSVSKRGLAGMTMLSLVLFVYGPGIASHFGDFS
jgi:hypothetical protein